MDSEELKFQREKWQDERQLRERELDIKQKEIDIREKDYNRSRWTSPWGIAIITGVLAFFGAVYTGYTQLKLENAKAKEARILEDAKAQEALILEVIKNDPANRAAKNLKFLVDTELIADPLREKVRNKLQDMASATAQRINPAFQDVRHAIVAVVGNPVEDGVLVDDAYQAVYEHATVVWIKNLLTIFVLPRDQTDKRTIRYQEGHFTIDKRLFNDDEAREIFKTPQGKSPPHGGMAALWLSDPEKWKWIGWRNWHCRFFNKVYIQEFEKGTAIGPLLVHPEQGYGQVFVISNDGSWVSRITPSLKASKCGDVGRQFQEETQKP